MKWHHVAIFISLLTIYRNIDGSTVIHFIQRLGVISVWVKTIWYVICWEDCDFNDDFINSNVFGFFQQEGSLCAQHCLNALLQGQYFSAVDLADIARQLDETEREQMAEAGTQSIEYQRFMQVSFSDIGL